MIKAEAPEGEDAEAIIRHYLSNKKWAKDLEIETITHTAIAGWGKKHPSGIVIYRHACYTDNGDDI